jgi:hypothetical protein
MLHHCSNRHSDISHTVRCNEASCSVRLRPGRELALHKYFFHVQAPDWWYKYIWGINSVEEWKHLKSIKVVGQKPVALYTGTCEYWMLISTYCQTSIAYMPCFCVHLLVNALNVFFSSRCCSRCRCFAFPYTSSYDYGHMCSDESQIHVPAACMCCLIHRFLLGYIGRSWISRSLMHKWQPH